jgi:tetratricopeptide (TPR) repeat protein
MLNYPLFGIGIGNWKIFGIGTHQNSITSYTTPYHVHNDFLQFGAELGILGFCSFFIFLFSPLIYMYRLRFNNEFKFLLPSFLLVFFVYFLDSSLNFPISRPLIQIQFLFILASIFYFYHKDLKSFIFNKSYLFLFPVILVLISISSFKVYDSYVKQDSLLNDFNKQKFVTSLDYIESIDDDYPNITATALPIKAIKANYYTNDSVVSRLLDLSIKDNPYIKYPQALKSIRFKDQGLLDSSLYFARDAFNAIPNNELHAIAYLSILTTLKDTIAMDSVLNITKSLNSSNIWSAYLSDLLLIDISFSEDKLSVFNQAIDLFPGDSRFEFYKKNFVMGDLLINETGKVYLQATSEFEQKKFLKSAQTYLAGSKLDPTDPSFLENAAHSYYLLKDKAKALKLFDSVINHYPNTTGKAHYLKGLMLVETYGEIQEPCRLFNIALKRGNTDAQKAIELFCN